MIENGLKIDPSNKEVMKTLRFHKAFASFMNEELQAAIEDSTEALKFDERNSTLFLLRAKSYKSLELHDDAIIDLLEVEKLKKCEKISSEIEDLRREIGKLYVKKSNYDFLEVPRTALELEISRSFTSLKLLHKVNISKALTVAEKRKLEFKFKRVENAFAILSNKKSKKIYDKYLSDEEANLESAMRRRECFERCFGCLGGCCTGFSNCCQSREVHIELLYMLAIIFIFICACAVVYFIWWSIGLWMIWPATFMLLLGCCYCCNQM